MSGYFYSYSNTSAISLETITDVSALAIESAASGTAATKVPGYPSLTGVTTNYLNLRPSSFSMFNGAPPSTTNVLTYCTAAGAIINSKNIPSSGYITIPDGCKSVNILTIGGGGGGGGNGGSSQATNKGDPLKEWKDSRTGGSGAGGGFAAYGQYFTKNLGPIKSLQVFLGAGGAAGPDGKSNSNVDNSKSVLSVGGTGITGGTGGTTYVLLNNSTTAYAPALGGNGGNGGGGGKSTANQNSSNGTPGGPGNSGTATAAVTPPNDWYTIAAYGGNPGAGAVYGTSESTAGSSGAVRLIWLYD